MSTKGTLNNQIVESLRRGNREAVTALIGFGVSPTREIDLVVASAPAGGVTTRTAWFWSHQSSCADAVSAWWEWMNRSLGVLEPDRRASFLAKSFAEAIEAALPENGATLLTSWEKSLEWTENERAPGWSRHVMMTHLSSCCSKLGNSCIPGFLALETAGFISKTDWSDQNRQRYARDPLTIAVKKGQVELVETLLDMGCSPITQAGMPILSEVWADFLETAEQSDNNLPGECEDSLLMMEKLLVRGLDWNVPLIGDKDKTVAQDAEGWIDLLKALPSRWESVTHQIEARILSQNTVSSTKKIKSPRNRL